ncbi:MULTISPECIES: 23S rRNA (pseudouridine(1915)-N(3))-methyltransferase RlmH [Terrabacteria group]|uniref:23S rRNA (pseudouridine(1915)-N(3))-methyltransferase RlmH n=1 Tax=Bacillati TaxID=1783272 RepID=UPI001939EF7C|nr:MULTISPECIES: 23S rRNA (pseudouridine(1915)-N(3))-methyltransferase RlmH [Terrabacteria group]MBW9212615.1 23S rRNA (pseudouridine(1915)-N(3))-methyltransferase RlmH [Trueperella sp. zg.1013]QRG86892.1 23S rRNA (pseudouridine(1915)-N(3))-methyltransferase RlmH [Bulleidia sp. zg-1006]
MIRIIVVGKVKEAWMRSGIQEYLKRLSAYEKIEVVEVNDEKAPESNSNAQNDEAKKKEGARLLKKIKDQEYVILLDLAGKMKSSEELSRQLDQLYTQGKSQICFVIGGSLGFSSEVIARANDRWCLSLSTFPHQLVRILLLEQIYRSFRILNHEPYHK